jgi:glutathione S-transferase
MLELDDGTQIGESTAICRYIEELYPEPNLFGRTPLERATIEMWHQRVDNQGEAAAEEAFRNSFPPFAERALAGSAEPVLQIPPLVGRGRASLGRFLQMLERQLSAAPFIAGGRFTMADISALCACDMGKIAGVALPQNFSHLRTWYDSIAQRPSARA